MHDDAETPSLDQRFTCPGCDEAVDVSAEAVGQLVRCPYCNTEFFAAEGRTHDLVVDDTPPEPPDAGRDPDELNAMRVRQLAALKLATLRTRSWWLIGLFAAAVVAIELLGKAALYVRAVHRWGVRPTLFVLAAAALGWFARIAWRQARQLAREAAKSSLAEPTDPPDFSTLDNGSDRWRRLEQL